MIQSMRDANAGVLAEGSPLNTPQTRFYQDCTTIMMSVAPVGKTGHGSGKECDDCASCLRSHVAAPAVRSVGSRAAAAAE